MNQLARCAYCSKPFIRTRPSKLYCTVQCTDKAAHHRARVRGKLIAEQQYADEQRVLAAASEKAATEIAASQSAAEAAATAARDKLHKDSADAIADLKKIIGYKEDE